MKNILWLSFLFALFFIACDDDSSTSSSAKVVDKVDEPVESVEPTEVTVGFMTDSRDGQTYKTVTIGRQTWMAQNLNYKADSSWCGGGVKIARIEGDCSKYGRLYSWAAAMDSAGTWSTSGRGCGYGLTCTSIGTVRGVCPEGWHLPDSSEWRALIDLGGGKRVAGKILKSMSGWERFNDNGEYTDRGNGTDAFSFSALPAGLRKSDGFFHDQGDRANFCSSTENGGINAYIMFLTFDKNEAFLDNYYKNYAYSVRCIKD